MKTKLILKGILLYTTMIVAILFICSVDSIYNRGFFFPAICIVAILIYICYKTISRRELLMLSGNKPSKGIKK